ncbi:MAG: methyltransferase domain-containing protein [Candidatus Rokubacteria bacterium]|nr:methyltransferase domain-containing protein [Candidatus Rokubacteria bacterium]
MVGRAIAWAAGRDAGRCLGLSALPRLAGAVEHGDRAMAASDLATYLDDLERLNRWFGGYRFTAAAMDRLAGDGAAPTPLVVADLGGARGDFARWLVRRARRRGRPVRVLVVDRDHAALAAGRERADGDADVLWVQADATALPLRARAVDVATTSLTLHHLEPPAAVAMLGALRRVARLGVVVNDLLRTRLAYLLVRIAVRALCRHPFSHDDGPLSVLRAYLPREIEELARAAGFSRLAIRTYPLFARTMAVGS